MKELNINIPVEFKQESELDEQEQQLLAQAKEAKRLLDESWEKYKANCSGPDEDADLILNPGKAIFPIGG